ncbi:hypothetical protein BX600DRAFT_167919 [Xylariales sp. PMI_506]|nr:hypothetical protein BX600DRAFT_167919 [Xylariales sp. PMI_506]
MLYQTQTSVSCIYRVGLHMLRNWRRSSTQAVATSRPKGGDEGRRGSSGFLCSPRQPRASDAPNRGRDETRRDETARPTSWPQGRPEGELGTSSCMVATNAEPILFHSRNDIAHPNYKASASPLAFPLECRSRISFLTFTTKTTILHHLYHSLLSSRHYLSLKRYISRL